MIRVLALLSVLFAAPMVWADDLDRAIDAYDAENFEAAYELFLPLAEQGNGYYVSRLSRMLDGVEPGPEAELAVEAFVETVLPGREFMKGELAAMRYPAAERFRDIAQPTLILALGSEFHDEVRRALDIVPDSRLAAAPELNRLAFRTDPAAVAPLVRAFLDGES